MYSHTKKVGSIGRHGPRVGRKLRQEVGKIEDEKRRSSTCPSCGRGKLKRSSAGIWNCSYCGIVFTGGTHLPAPRKRG